MNEITVSISSVFSILLLIVLVFWLFRDYSIDSFRQKIFRLRDGLFDEALKGNISFDDPAYVMMRRSFNGFIRFAHKMSLMEVIIFMIFSSRKDKDELNKGFIERLESNTSHLTEEQKEMIDGYFKRMNMYMVEYLVLTSPLLLLTVIIPLAVVLMANRLLQKIINSNRFSTSIDRLDSMALASGSLRNC